jgi:hypothetical protein
MNTWIYKTWAGMQGALNVVDHDDVKGSMLSILVFVFPWPQRQFEDQAQ